MGRCEICGKKTRIGFFRFWDINLCDECKRKEQKRDKVREGGKAAGALLLKHLFDYAGIVSAGCFEGSFIDKVGGK